MTASDITRWARAKQILGDLLDLPPEQRQPLLTERCGTDALLRRDVESLLSAYDRAGAFAQGSAAASLVQPTLHPGERIGRFLVLQTIGSGGMGEVYLARDEHLARDVALKVLPRELVADAAGLARFNREARTLATLNHPNISAIYGVEEGVTPDGAHVRALVLEYLPGATLAERLAASRLPVAEACTIALQILDALVAAHVAGIIHRDLKPANVKFAADGKAKVLDFGLARIAAPVGGLQSGGDVSVPGVVLGTPPYMSPEQARGEEIDQRTDVWAFGCVVFEMVTGVRAFVGESATDILASVVHGEPDWSRLRHVPPALCRLVRRCLDKDPNHRYQHIGDTRFDLEEALGTRRRVGRAVVQWSVGALVAAAAVAVAVLGWRALVQAAPPPELRLEITTPPTDDPVSLALSPDGRQLVFVATTDGVSRLWVRALNALDPRPLRGTEGATYPFWSPDSQHLGFFSDDKLKRVDLPDGSVETLADAHPGRGGSWGRGDVILFAPTSSSAIYRIAAAGGDPVPVTRLEPGQESHRTPEILPDGRHFLYFSRGSQTQRGVYVGALDGQTTRRLVAADAPATYSDGFLWFVRRRALYKQPFDAPAAVLSGTPQMVAANIAVDVTGDAAAISVSAAGPIAYRPGPGATARQFVWYDRTGRELSRIGQPDTANLLNPAVSPDGRYIAVERDVEGNGDIWLLDTERGSFTRFTSDPLHDVHPMWSPDGSRLVFGSDRGGAYDLYEKPASGTAPDRLLLHTSETKNVSDWSRDGRFLLFRRSNQKNGFDIWALPLVGDRTPFPVVATEFQERDAQFSPDGRWVAYQSNRSGVFDIYVRPFTGQGTEIRVSTMGGVQPRWRADGRELFYVDAAGALTAATVRRRGDTLEPDRPTSLFTPKLARALGNYRQQYAVSPDGQRFLMNTTVATQAAPVVVILNWKR